MTAVWARRQVGVPPSLLRPLSLSLASPLLPSLQQASLLPSSLQQASPLLPSPLLPSLLPFSPQQASPLLPFSPQQASPLLPSLLPSSLPSSPLPSSPLPSSLPLFLQHASLLPSPQLISLQAALQLFPLSGSLPAFLFFLLQLVSSLQQASHRLSLPPSLET